MRARAWRTEGDYGIIDGVIPRSARRVVAIRQYGTPALPASCSLSIKPVNTLIYLQNHIIPMAIFIVKIGTVC
jgi:hypothetical protein